MASKSPPLFLFFLNLMFLTLVSSYCPTPSSPPPPPKHSPPPPPPSPPPPSPPPPSPPPPTPSPPPPTESCPVNTLKFGVCASTLGGLIHFELGKPPKKPCCTLFQGLADYEAALCLCTAIKENVLGIKINIPIEITLLLNYCGKEVPHGYICA